MSDFPSSETLPESPPECQPTEAIWDRLLAGDPGPAVALFDALMDADFAFAAGGLLRDLAERLNDADEVVHADQRDAFLRAMRQAIHHCLQDDQQAVDALMEEVKEE